MAKIDSGIELQYLSKSLIRLALDADEWQSLQFHHLREFTFLICHQCHYHQCFSCGHAPHPSLGCAELLAETSLREEDAETAEWKRLNTKKCPRCCIYIARDDGCNKMSCCYCGFEFCW
jgi:hypothetical protein